MVLEQLLCEDRISLIIVANDIAQVCRVGMPLRNTSILDCSFFIRFGQSRRRPGVFGKLALPYSDQRTANSQQDK